MKNLMSYLHTENSILCKWWHETSKNKIRKKRGVKTDARMRSVTVWLRLHHVTSQIYSYKAAWHAAAGFSSTASLVKTAWKRYLRHHSQPSNTALWGTQQTGLAFRAQAATLQDNWLSVTMQSNKINTTNATRVWREADFRLQSSLASCAQFSLFWISLCCLLKKENHHLKE